MRVPIIAIAFFAIPLGAAKAADYRVQDAGAFRRTVGVARPGDRILVAAGNYRGNFYFKNVHGAAGKPIAIVAANPDRPPHFIGETIGMQFTGASYLELSDLVLTGAKENGLNIDDAGIFAKPAHHITLRNVRVADIGPRGNHDGIKLSGVDDFLVVGCTVERWGSGGSGIDMVGCHRGVIRRCEFKRGGANAVQAKGGSAEITILRCRFEDCGERAINAGGRSVGNFRPPLQEMPADARYELKTIRIEGCTFSGGEAAIALVGVDGAVVRYNTIYRPANYAFRILQENTDAGFLPCRNGVFENNIIVFRSEKWGDGGVNVGPGTAPGSFKFSRNFWYCEDRPLQSAPKLPVAETDAAIGKDPLFRDAAKRDFAVKPGSPAADRGAHALPEPK